MELILTVTIAALYVLGLVLTGWGLFNAVITTQRDIHGARDRVEEAERLETRHRAESAKLTDDLERRFTAEDSELGGPPDLRKREAREETRKNEFAILHARHEDEYSAARLVRPQYNRISRMALYESQWLLQRILTSNRWNLVLVGSGLVVTTIASITALFLP